MFLRFLLFFLFLIPNAHSTGLPPCVDLGMSIEEIRYESTTYSMDALVSLPGACNDNALAKAYEIRDSSVFVLYQRDSGDLLLRQLGSDGSVSNLAVYDLPPFQPEKWIMLSSELYIFDEETNAIYFWNKDLDVWSNLSSASVIPSGTIELVQVVQDKLLFSIQSSDTDMAGTWQVDNEQNVTKLSAVSQDDNMIWSVNNELIQLIGDKENGYEITSLTQASSNLPMIMEETVYFYFAYPSDNGVLYVFYVPSGPKFHWDDMNNGRDVWLEFSDFNYILKGCFNSNSDIYCAVTHESEKTHVYKLNRGEFEIDSEITYTQECLESADSECTEASEILSTVVVKDIYSYGASRFINAADGDGHYLYELNQSGIIKQISITDTDERDVKFNRLIRTDQADVLYWLTQYSDGITLSRLNLSLDDAYESLVNANSGTNFTVDYDGTDPESRTPDDSIPDKPNAELSGSFSLFVILNMLLLLSYRRRS